MPARPISSLTAPRRRPCALISCGCGSPPSPTFSRALGSHRPQAHPVRQGQLRHHPSQASQDRRARARLGPPHQARYGLGLPQPARIRDRPCPAGRGRALTNQTAHSPQSPRRTPPIGGARRTMPAFASRRRPARFGSRNSLLQRASTPTIRSDHPCREKCGLALTIEPLRQFIPTLIIGVVYWRCTTREHISQSR